MRTPTIVLFVLMASCLFAATGLAAAPDPSGAVVVVRDEAVDAEFEAELTGTVDGEPVGFPDPLEPMNRVTLAFNRTLDHWLIDPITDVYQFVVPDPARRSVRRFLSNLDSPAVLANDLLQREWHDARITISRFGINSTLGVVGFFDTADWSFGMEGHTSDFGQTLALEGVPSGAYIVLPLIGPTTVRDGIGEVVDVLFRPATFFLGPIEQLFYTTIHGGSTGLALRDAHAEELAMLEESSVDYYAALRNAYFQTRTVEIWERRSDYDSISAVAMSYWSGPLAADPEIHALAE